MRCAAPVLDVLRRRPRPPLDAFVTCVWTCERPALPHAREWGLPSGCADLIVPLADDHLLRFDGAHDRCGRRYAGGVVQGAQQHAFLRDTSRAACTAGVHFRPDGLAALFAPPADTFSDRVLALPELWGGFAAELRERLVQASDATTRLDRLEALLVRRLRHHAPADRMVAWALGRFAAGAASVGAVQRASGCSADTFIRRFRAATGLAPKRHVELLRFARTVERAHAEAGTCWADAAQASGYADQAHLTREFRRFAGITPVTYRKLATPLPMHVAAA